MRSTHPLPHEPSSAGLARAHVRAALADGWASPERMEDAMLLVTELIANAVIHGSPAVELDIEVDGAELLVRVRDGSVAPLRMPGEPGAGRGLGIVDTLADRWGVEGVGGPQVGKAVWFEMKG